MKIYLKIIACLLLLFNGIGAIYGGLNLVIYPDGSSIQLSMEWLKYTPFHNYLIPGIILLVANGFLSMLVFIYVILNIRGYPLFVMGQGAILTGWIAVQIIMMQTVYFLHIVLDQLAWRLW